MSPARVPSEHRYHRITYHHPSRLHSINEAVVSLQILGYYNGTDEYWVVRDAITCRFVCRCRGFRGPCLHVQGSPRINCSEDLRQQLYTIQHGVISLNISICCPVEHVRWLLYVEGKDGVGRFTSGQPMYRNLV